MKERNYFMVGVFVSVGLCLLAVLLFVFSEQEDLFSRQVRIHGLWHNISGLKTGSAVNLSGVFVGNVAGIRFMDNGRIEVAMNIHEKYLPQIPKDSLATISATSLLGDKAVFIEKGTLKQDIADGQEITTKEPFDITQYFDQVGGMVDTLDKTLNNIQTISAHLAEEELNLKTTVNRVNDILAYIDSGQGNVGKMLKDRQLYDNMVSVTEQLNQSVGDVKRVTGDLSGYMEDIKQDMTGVGDIVRNLQDASQNVYLGFRNIPEIMSDLRSVIELTKFTIEGIQHNPLVGPFIPSSKETFSESTFELLGEDS